MQEERLRRLAVWGPVVLLFGCADDARPLDPGPSDAGAKLWERNVRCERDGVQIPFGMRYASYGNECWCGTMTYGGCDVHPQCGGVHCETETCDLTCYTALLLAQNRLTCTPTAACSSGGSCRYAPGCGEPRGACVYTQSQCSSRPYPPDGGEAWMLFCGCDGVTYQSDCAHVPYAHSGPCE